MLELGDARTRRWEKAKLLCLKTIYRPPAVAALAVVGVDKYLHAVVQVSIAVVGTVGIVDVIGDRSSEVEILSAGFQPM